ncbi:hypothetical protein T310_8412 [Rasamsonia emersonii CBS 393.64]|uniref:Fungal N-terminal domain-containing protein n=1 Tax=Rasamsonia emersonii (strain ATCC 16479 / CBS 393.64 / IMI 116815) TaxID=1408163 RepID=A0A0F4YHJ7_RASE3|nr:hypothetical protein T310_8412 [Rasamsonia emersonii CBS 393.64]KKA17644.1 hypothetical protein T310_8412 [Rasamsonia emersonii CBS 393.64]
MLDPLTCLSLASNIVQFVSFTSDLISKSHQIYKSTTGTLIENTELEAITLNLESISKGFVLQPPKGTFNKFETDEALYNLSKDCQRASQDLLNGLHKLKSGEERISDLILHNINKTRLLEADFIDTTYRSNWQSQNENDVLHFSAKLSDTAEKEKDRKIRCMILDQLRFSHMVDRYESIPKALFGSLVIDSNPTQLGPSHIIPHEEAYHKCGRCGIL